MAGVAAVGRAPAYPRRAADAPASRPQPPSSASGTVAKIVGAGVATGGGVTILGAYGLGRPFSASAAECLKGVFSSRGVFTREGLLLFGVLSGIAIAVLGLLTAAARLSKS